MRFRSILILILATIATFSIQLTTLAAPSKAPSYTPAQLEQIHRYSETVEELRDRLLEIPPLVQQKRWIDLKDFIHGPLGELRVQMGRLTRSLDPKVQADARKAGQEVFEQLMLIDEATQPGDARKALRSYNGMLQEFDKFLQYVPQ